jgi:hypothetical protein
MCYYLLLFWLYIIMSTSLQFVAFKQACFFLNCNIYVICMCICKICISYWIIIWNVYI